MSADELAPPGISGDLWSVQCKPETSEDEIRALLDDQTERDFEVRCVFFRETGFSRDLDTQTRLEVGTSFFTIPDGSPPGWFESAGARYEVVVNGEREIAGVRSRIRAHSVRESRTMFVKGLAPVVDHLAYLSNTPIITSDPVCHDEKHLTWVVGYTSPYSAKVIKPGQSVCHSELAPVYGLYREAKNATSPFYRFFCYYKILEGVFGSLRPQLFKRAAARGITLTTRKEVIPENRELRMFASNLIGRPVKEYFDNVLQKQFRNAVAHYVLDTGTILSPSEPDAVTKFVDVILPAELSCRTVVDQHQLYLDELEGPARA